LVDVASNAQIWAESYAVGESDLAATAQKIALAAREQILRHAHGGTFQPPLYHPAVRMTENPEAFREYLKGTTFGMNAARATVEDGIRHLQESIRLDPGFGRAWSSLGIAHIAQTFFGDLSASQTIAQAKAEAKKALELDTSSYAGWRVLGAASHYYDWDHIAAEKQFLRSIELNPQDAGTLLWFAFALADMRRFDEALTYIKRASDADPRWLEVETCRGDIYYFMGKTDQAIAVYLRNLESQPNYGLSRHYLGRAYLAKGQFEEAIAQLRRGNELLGQVPFSAADLGYALAVAGHSEEAEKMLAAMMRKREQGYYPAFAIALVHLGLGHIDLALDWLERTVDERLAGYYFPWVDPFYNSVRSNPRFQKLMRQMNFGG
jgi:tetratricopeptide (TPR) repeat protein